MISHLAWRGPNQAEGIKGKKVLIVGYSHYCNESEMSDVNVTRNVLSNVMSGEATHAFWSSIGNYFGLDRKEFWSRVGFMNYVPCCIGLEEDKFRTATAAEVEGAEVRLLDEMDAQNVDVAFVFTSKGSFSLKQQLSSLQPKITKLIPTAGEDVREDYVFEDVHVNRGGTNTGSSWPAILRALTARRCPRW